MWLSATWLFLKMESLPDNMVCPGFSSCCSTEIDVPIDLRWVSQGISGFKDVKTLVLYDVESETSMDSMKGKCASS